MNTNLRSMERFWELIPISVNFKSLFLLIPFFISQKLIHIIVLAEWEFTLMKTLSTFAFCRKKISGLKSRQKNIVWTYYVLENLDKFFQHSEKSIWFSKYCRLKKTAIIDLKHRPSIYDQKDHKNFALFLIVGQKIYTFLYPHNFLKISWFQVFKVLKSTNMIS